MGKSEIKRLRDQLESKQDIFYNLTSSCWESSTKKMNEGDTSITFDSIKRDIKLLTGNLGEEIADLTFILKKLEPIEYGDIPTYGSLMTLEHFKNCVKSGGFIDYDGYGNYATKNKVTNKIIVPSHVTKNRVLKNSELTHVIWYNR